MRRGRRAAWALFIAWTVLTCVALLLPFDLSRPIVGRGFDKVAHTAMFTALGALAQTALPWASLLFTLPLAAGLEHAQRFVPRREFNRVDLYANLIGAALGALLAEGAWRLRR
ncbi:MAG: VanZ family protein [bacterium]